MVKFKFYFNTPYGGRYNTHYAKTAKRARDTIDQWNEEFKDTGYSVHLVDIRVTSEKKVPKGYTIW